MILYEIHARIESVLNRLEHLQSGEPSMESVAEVERLSKELETLDLNVEMRRASLVGALKNLEAEEVAIAAEISRLSARKKQKQRSIDWIKNTLLVTAKPKEVWKSSDNVHGFAVRTSKVVQAAIEELEDIYIRTKVSREPDKVAIKEVLGAGGTVKGAVLVERPYLAVE